MKVVKPMKVPVLTRVLERARRPEFHVAAMLGFPLGARRVLLDELAFWAAVSSVLGPAGIIDEGFAKSRGEVLIAGSFHAPGGTPLPASYVRVKLGAIDKGLAIIGNRLWQDHAPTDPELMTTMPIDWAHAFGGPKFPRNPYGKGAEPIDDGGQTHHPLPNVERYLSILRSPSDRPDPSGFLPMDVTFAQRRERAGTYDQRWLDEHFPGLAPDAAATFFNVAPEDQWIDSFFRGDEGFVIENMHPDYPRLEGRLPGLLTRCFITRRTPEGERFVEIPLRCDTVWLFPGAGLGSVIFHGTLPISEDDAADIVHLVAACEDPTSPRAIEHYQRALARRLDKDKGAVADLSDSDLMPTRGTGVAPNIGELDIGRWVRTENLAAKNLRRGHERKLGEMRAVVEAEGLDPKTYGLAERPPEPEAPPVDDLDALAAYMEAQLASAEVEMKGLDAKAEEARNELRKAFAEMGEDYDAMMERASREGAGPPKFSAAEHLEMLREMAVSAREGGAPLEELEQQLASPSYRAQVVQQERGLRQMYQRFGHLQPAAPAMEPAASEQTRVLVQLALETGESLARRDFTGAYLAGARLAGLDLSGAFLESVDLSGCDLTGANLEDAVLAKANLRGATLSRARLRGANLGGAVLCDAVLEQVDLTNGVLSRAELAGARVIDAKLAGVDWAEAKLRAVDLSGSSLAQCNLLKADLRGTRFVGADLSDANLIECELDGANFSRAKLEKTTFVGCKGEGVSFREARLRQGILVHGSSFPDADFRNADMERANLRGTSLPWACFEGANLSGADLSECDASGASFERAVMKGAMMIRTNLAKASLQGANLVDVLASKAKLPAADFTGANLYRADLSRVIGDAKTTFAEAEVGHVRYLPKADVPAGGAS